MIARFPPRRALTFIAQGHIRAALAVVALYLLRARWFYWPLSIFMTLIIYLYAIRPMLRLVFP
jgi:hypothetical protein